MLMISSFSFARSQVLRLTETIQLVKFLLCQNYLRPAHGSKSHLELLFNSSNMLNPELLPVVDVVP
jgi:hypothetical protein